MRCLLGSSGCLVFKQKERSVTKTDRVQRLCIRELRNFPGSGSENDGVGTLAMGRVGRVPSKWCKAAGTRVTLLPNLSHTHTHTHSYSHSLTLTYTLPHTHTPSHTHTSAHTLTLTHSLTLPHTHGC